MLNEKYVSIQKHPEFDLYIYNYTAKAQYDKIWNEITTQTRGLILDKDLNIVARPFKKFWNLEEHKPTDIPTLPFEVFEKMDGSLLILFFHKNQWLTATRGSFTSEQAIKRKELLKKYNINLLDKTKTSLFEVIYKENRIVLDYGDYEGLVLLTSIETLTGIETPYNELLKLDGFDIVKRYDGINDINELKKLEENNKEGFVIRFSNGFRVKVKFEEYVRLHRIITGVSNKTIWEYLSEGKSMDEILDRVPDEFYNYVKYVEKDLKNKFDDILNECKSIFKEFETRKETALYFQKQKYPKVLFNMLDGRSPDNIIWKNIKPIYQKPFKVEVE
jgi:RNA ligase